jgi:hypothetical protein
MSILLGDHTIDEYAPIVPEAIKLGVELKLWNDVFFLPALHTGCRYMQYYKSDIPAMKAMIDPIFEYIEANKDTMIPSNVHLVATVCSLLVDIQVKQELGPVVAQWQSLFEQYKQPSDEGQLVTFIGTASAVIVALSSAPGQRQATVDIIESTCRATVEALRKNYVTDSDTVLADYFGILQVLVTLKEAQLTVKLIDECREALGQVRPADVPRFDASIDSLLPDLKKKAAMQARASSRKAKQTGSSAGKSARVAKTEEDDSDDEDDETDSSDDDDSDDDDEEESSEDDDEDSNKFRRKRSSKKRNSGSNTLMLVAVAGAAAALGLVSAFVAIRLMKKNSSN